MKNEIFKKRKNRIATALLCTVVMLLLAIGYYMKGPGEFIPMACPVYRLLGYYCPGCGAGRATYALLHGKIGTASRYNPLMMLILPILAIYYVVILCQWIIIGRETISEKISWKIPSVIFVIIIIYGVIRNIPAFPFTLLAP